MSVADRHYVGEASQEYHEKKRAIPDVAMPWVARLRAEKLQPFIQKTDTVFEFGAGYGWNMVELHCGRKVAYGCITMTATTELRSGLLQLRHWKTTRNEHRLKSNHRRECY